MKRTFCDRCGKEEPYINYVEATRDGGPLYFYPWRICFFKGEFCIDCLNEIHKFVKGKNYPLFHKEELIPLKIKRGRK